MEENPKFFTASQIQIEVRVGANDTKQKYKVSNGQLTLQLVLAGPVEPKEEHDRRW
jgi:hypothetical protein